MPLRDHFRELLRSGRHWQSFHSAWATFLAAALNRVLPDGFFAEPNVQFGIEIDVAAFDEDASNFVGDSWRPPAPSMMVPLAIVTDVVEVLVYRKEGGAEAVGCLELVSPANKDRPEHRNAFLSKCCSYLHQAIGLVVVDVVTTRHAELHRELTQRVANVAVEIEQPELWAASYRPAPQPDGNHLQIWLSELTLGQPLPTLPFLAEGRPLREARS
jgi:hypothetical protein